MYWDGKTGRYLNARQHYLQCLKQCLNARVVFLQCHCTGDITYDFPYPIWVVDHYSQPPHFTPSISDKSPVLASGTFISTLPQLAWDRLVSTAFTKSFNQTALEITTWAIYLSRTLMSNLTGMSAVLWKEHQCITVIRKLLQLISNVWLFYTVYPRAMC